MVTVRERAHAAFQRLARGSRLVAPWLVYALTAYYCTKYLNERTDLVPKRGIWYCADGHPYIYLQVRSFLHGKLALLPHPWMAGHDYIWGRNGMHTAWGLGVPLIATPFHIVGLWLGRPGFPDNLRFLVLYGLTTFVLARVFHRASREPTALVTGAATAGFIMVFPTFVGLVASRFQIYEQTIATGALWSVLLLGGVVALGSRCTPARLVAVCAAAGFAIVIRAPLAVYGAATLVLALFIAQRAGFRWRVLAAGLVAYGASTTVFFLLPNYLRFGSAFSTGYENVIGGNFVGRLIRWGLPFEKTPFKMAVKEMFATLFLLDPVPSQIIGSLPPAIYPYAYGERWREYYAPTFDRLILAIWALAFVIVCVNVVRGLIRLRAGDAAPPRLATLVGAWAVPTVLVLFFFYARHGAWVTRYATDFYPGFAAGCVCVGMSIVDAVRKRSVALAPSARLAMAGCVALYLPLWTGWATHLSQPADKKTFLSRIDAIDARAKEVPPFPTHFKCGEPRGPQPVHTHLEGWNQDCTVESGTVFAMIHSPCVEFTFRPHGAAWTPDDGESLAGFRAYGDLYPMVSCGAPKEDGLSRKVTMCDRRPPRYLLDGMQLYAIAQLDDKLQPIDRLKLMSIDPLASCP
ncbi:MAG TPA: hypothetical protein VGM06_07475 [Polyangiaceae bacterium]|jgi:hypothetical protein